MRILGSDFDGTLTHRLGEETFAAIRAWREAGNKFGIVSGRGTSFFFELKKKYPDLEMDFFVGYNGTAILDGNGTLLYEKRYTEVSSEKLVEDLLDWDCPCAFYSGDRFFCVVRDREDIPDWIDKTDGRFPDDLPVLPYFVQISTLCPEGESKAAEVVEKIREAYGNTLNPLQNGICIDIVPPGINKTTGLLRVAEHFGVTAEDVIAVGDNINDTDMIRDFYSYAMERGVDSIKKLVDATTETVAELIWKELEKQ